MKDAQTQILLLEKSIEALEHQLQEVKTKNNLS